MSMRELDLRGRYSTKLIVRDSATPDHLQLEIWDAAEDFSHAGVTLDHDKMHMLYLYLEERLRR